MVDRNGRNEILSNNSFYLQLVNGGNFFATPFISKSLSVKLFPGRNEIYARGKWRESVRDVDENFLARSLIPHDDCIVEPGKTIVHRVVLIYSLFN